MKISNFKFQIKQMVRSNFWLLLVLTLILLLRLPSFFEPYWYGDEGIYLAIGQAMQRGAILYRDIWDNKPPLLYLIYALNPILLWAKISATVAVLGTSLVTYMLAKKILSNHQPPTTNSITNRYSLITSLLVGVFLSLPLLEGTIANAELYFTLPIALAAYFLYTNLLTTHYSLLTTVLVGLLMTIAFLLKVPAILDFLGLFLAATVITFVNKGGLKHFVFSQMKFYSLILLPFFISLFFLLFSFFSHGALSDFLTAAFSQNATYVSVASGQLSQLTNPLFLKAITLISLTSLTSLLYLRRKISRELLFLSLWFSFSLYATLLSGRSYMHYLLQIVPPAVILFFYLLFNIRKYSYVLVIFLFVIFALIHMFSGAFALNSYTYYQNWFDYISERKTWEEYASYFDPRTLNSYAIANYLTSHTSPTDPIFVWGDNSMIYVLANRSPATKFIQAHHLTTVNPDNYHTLINRLIKFPPKIIIVSRPVQFSFPKLEDFVQKNYRLVDKLAEWFIYQTKSQHNQM